MVIDPMFDNNLQTMSIIVVFFCRFVIIVYKSVCKIAINIGIQIILSKIIFRITCIVLE